MEEWWGGLRGEWARSFAQRGAQRQPNLRQLKPREPRETFMPLLFQERCRHIIHAMLPTLTQVSAGAKYDAKLVPNLPSAGEKK